MSGTLVLLSGGQDSATSLIWALQNTPKSHACLTLFYGQRHEVEISAATDIAREFGLLWKLLDVSELFSRIGVGGGLLRHSEAVEGPSEYDASLPASFTPGRNLIFLSCASIEAALSDLDHIVAGMCQTDYSGYPDCRSEFLAPFSEAACAGLNRPIKFHFPVLNISKADTWALADKLGHLELIRTKTHTCYNGVRETLHDWGYGCGNCPACKIRAEGYTSYVERQAQA